MITITVIEIMIMIVKRMIEIMTMIDNSRPALQDVVNHRMSQEIFNRQHMSLRNEYPLIGSPGKAIVEKGNS